MSIPAVRRVLVLLLLALALTASVASAAGLALASPRGVASAGPDLDIISRFWGFLANVLGEEGCMIDPDGRCVTQPATTTQGDTGCMVDPNGRCRG